MISITEYTNSNFSQALNDDATVYEFYCSSIISANEGYCNYIVENDLEHFGLPTLLNRKDWYSRKRFLKEI